MKTLKLFFLATIIIASYTLSAQVAVTTDGSSADPSAMLDVQSTEKGMLIPRMTQTDIEAITSPANGLTVFCTTDDTFYTFILAANVWKEIQYGTGIITPYTPEVGDSYGGGIIFYLDGTGEHGLIASTTDQSTGIQWFNGSYVTTGASGTALGTGGTNTTAIIAVQGATATDYAAGLARAHDGGGYDDWFLPSKDELNLMYLNIGPGNALGLGNIGGFASASYWSSSEYSSYAAWKQYFSSGGQGYSSRSYAGYVRAVRAF